MKSFDSNEIVHSVFQTDSCISLYLELNMIAMLRCIETAINRAGIYAHIFSGAVSSIDGPDRIISQNSDTVQDWQHTLGQNFSGEMYLATPRIKSKPEK